MSGARNGSWERPMPARVSSLVLAVGSLALLVSVGSIASTGGEPAVLRDSTAAAEGVREAFERYRDASRKRDARAAAALASEASIAHYAILRDLARAPAAVETSRSAGLRTVDGMQVEMLRELVPAERLKGMTPDETLAFVFERRLLGGEFEETSTLGPMSLEGEGATAVHLARGRAVGAPFREATLRFVREHGDWRVDLLHTLDLMELQLEDLARYNGVPTEELATNIVGVVTGEALAEGMDGLRQRGLSAASVPPPAGEVEVQP